MANLSVAGMLAWVLALFFVAVGVYHMVGVQRTRNQFRAWGFPPGAYFVNGLLQALAGVLVAIPALRLFGLALAAALMLAAAATLIAHKKYKRSTAAWVINALIILTWIIH